MTIWVFGNPDLPSDALPIRLVPELRRRYPEHTFALRDPLEEWDVPDDLVILDTVKGITAVTEFKNLDGFSDSPRVTMHDYDLGTTLKWLRKLGKLPAVRIIGIPPNAEEADVLRDLEPILKAL
ncbi:MAG: hypothetical protein HY341_02495 [Candidatus Kerfeldbacteria bacterium]|nr:hypothetical protein [Candidatus Kerfeldbacteria bacterium]